MTFPASGTSYVLSSPDGAVWTWSNPGYVEADGTPGFTIVHSNLALTWDTTGYTNVLSSYSDDSWYAIPTTVFSEFYWGAIDWGSVTGNPGLFFNTNNYFGFGQGTTCIGCAGQRGILWGNYDRAYDQLWYQAVTVPDGSFINVLIKFRNRYTDPATNENYARVSLFRGTDGIQYIEFAYIDTADAANVGIFQVNS
ncbi:MAG: hypothetical protein E6Q56_12400 [Mycobacterium sp.]|nr:MAG: hypothetical protein E6Q56_12400 [Mycobacterium sp.]